MAELLPWTPDQYQADTTRIRSSQVKNFIDNPAKMWLTDNDPEMDNETEAKILGTLLHDLVFFDTKNYLVSDLHRNSNAFKDLKAANADKVILKPDGYFSERTLLNMREALAANTTAWRLLTADGFHESVIAWDDEGLACKCMLDLLGNDGSIVDLKSTRDADPNKFPRQAFSLGYDISAVWYERGRDALLGGMDAPYYWVAIQSKYPHWVRVYEITPETREQARRRVEVALPELRRCQASGVWPDVYADQIHPV